MYGAVAVKQLHKCVRRNGDDKTKRPRTGVQPRVRQWATRVADAKDRRPTKVLDIVDVRLSHRGGGNQSTTLLNHEVLLPELIEFQ